MRGMAIGMRQLKVYREKDHGGQQPSPANRSITGIKTFMKEGIHQRGMKTIFRKKKVE
ncbi:MAG: hypothetical protein H6Q26_3057 [Bacteroidetes bacterium]|nr:hypothetical protein [Bacteroidota bacterium]